MVTNLNRKETMVVYLEESNNGEKIFIAQEVYLYKKDLIKDLKLAGYKFCKKEGIYYHKDDEDNVVIITPMEVNTKSKGK